MHDRMEWRNMQDMNTILKDYKQSIIIPYHKNKEMLYYVLKLLLDTVPKHVEIIVVANNYDTQQIEIECDAPQVRIYKIAKSMLYSEAMNLGVSYATGDIITMFDQDVFCFGNWYELLLEKLLSSPAIGAVSPKLINPTNNRIIDFGIAYSPQNILHPMRGLPYNHPISLSDRKVSSACGAVMMTYKILYEKVGGMDKTMPYICCDCDYGIQIQKEGYETWVVANACVYHKGSSSTQNTKITEYSYLRGDSKAMFFAKNYALLNFDMKNFIEEAGNFYKKSHSLHKKYFLYNLSSLQDADFFIELIRSTLNIDYYDICTFNIGCRNPNQLQLYDFIPLSHLDITEPVIYLVDSITSLNNNVIWWKLRKCQNDIIVDVNGNFFSQEEIQKLVI